MIQFSIVIPTYNDLSLFKRAYYSIKDQKYATYEIIVVDDSSTNKIEHFVETCQDINLKYYHNKPSLGAINNWNYGLSLISGEYIILMHHDEHFDDPKFQLSAYIEKFENGNCDVIVSNTAVFHPNNVVKQFSIPKIIKTFVLNYLPSFLFFLNIIGSVSCIAFKKENLHFFNKNLNWLVDVEWYYRLINSKKVCVAYDLKINSIHNHPNQITINNNTNSWFKNDLIYLHQLYSKNLSVYYFLKINNFTNSLRKVSFLNFIWKNTNKK